ncbi:hypothetical protein VPH35_115821 [Triticum aestivum]
MGSTSTGSSACCDLRRLRQELHTVAGIEGNHQHLFFLSRPEVITDAPSILPCSLSPSQLVSCFADFRWESLMVVESTMHICTTRPASYIILAPHTCLTIRF